MRLENKIAPQCRILCTQKEFDVCGKFEKTDEQVEIVTTSVLTQDWLFMTSACVETVLLDFYFQHCMSIHGCQYVIVSSRDRLGFASYAIFGNHVCEAFCRDLQAGSEVKKQPYCITNEGQSEVVREIIGSQNASKMMILIFEVPEAK